MAEKRVETWQDALETYRNDGKLSSKASMCSENMACSRNSSDWLSLGLESNKAGDGDQQGRQAQGRDQVIWTLKVLKSVGFITEYYKARLDLHWRKIIWACEAKRLEGEEGKWKERGQ